MDNFQLRNELINMVCNIPFNQWEIINPSQFSTIVGDIDIRVLDNNPDESHKNNLSFVIVFNYVSPIELRSIDDNIKILFYKLKSHVEKEIMEKQKLELEEIHQTLKHLLAK